MSVQKHKFIKGQSLVEFAIIIPVLLLLVFGIFEFARVFLAYVTVHNCAQTAARFATTGEQFANPLVDPWDIARLAAIKAEARYKAISLNIDDSASPSSPGYFHVFVHASDPPILGTEYPGGPNARVAVDVVYNHPMITPLLNALFPFIQLTAHSEMINEQFRHPGYGTPIGVLPATIVPTPTPSFTPTSAGIPTIPPTHIATPTSPTSTPIQTSTRTNSPTSTTTATRTIVSTSTRTPSPSTTSTSTSVPTYTQNYTPTPTPCPWYCQYVPGFCPPECRP
jgi:Flp pilus assembly protein TadG